MPCPFQKLVIKVIPFFLFLTMIFQTNSFAQEENIEIEILSYEEMMKMLVVTASKEEENASDAPAIIDVFNEQQIKDLNITDLYDLLSYLPGIEQVEGYFGRTMMNFRGVKQTHYNNKVLMMINGNPIYEPTNGAFFLEMVPINSISRVEVIRGPGSSLYGTNAYAGVINIITKSGNGNNSYSARVGYGSNNTLRGELQGKFHLAEETGLYLAGSFLNTNGYPLKVKADETGASGEFNYYNKPFNAYLQFTASDFSIDAGYMSINKSLYGITPNLNYKGDAIFRSFYTNANYSYSFSDNVSSDLFIRYSNYDNPETNIGQFPVSGFAGHAPSGVHQTVKGSVFSAELQFNSKISGVLNNVTGVQFESFQTDPFLFVWDDDGTTHPLSAYLQEYSSNSFSAYSQFNYKATERMSVVAGLRLVKDKDIEDFFFAPRAGLIFRLSDQYAIKALYGKAFRSPSFFEKYVATRNVLFGSPTLVTENIQTIDLGIEADFSNSLSARLNGFYNKTSDGISRIPTTDPATQGANAAVYANVSESEIFGLELMVKGLIGNEGYYGINASWKTGKDIVNDVKVDMLGIAAFTANGWLNYKFDKLQLTPSFKFIGGREGTSVRLVNGTAVGNYTLDSYLLFNFTVSYKVNLLTFALTGSNLFDSEYSFPEYIRGRSEEVPGGPGRTIYASVRFDFTPEN